MYKKKLYTSQVRNAVKYLKNHSFLKAFPYAHSYANFYLEMPTRHIVQVTIYTDISHMFDDFDIAT